MLIMFAQLHCSSDNRVGPTLYELIEQLYVRHTGQKSLKLQGCNVLRSSRALSLHG